MTAGIHHVSAIGSDPQRIHDFYAGVLGLRLVKRTVNFDDAGTYHLYYGNGVGSPGTLMTLFAWAVPPLASARGRAGTGQIAATAFVVPAESVDWWADRLAYGAIDFDGPAERFGERVLLLRAPDGQRIELVGSDAGASGFDAWAGAPVPAQHAIRRLHGVTLWLDEAGATARLLEDVLGLRHVASSDDRTRYAASDGSMVDLVRPGGAAGTMGVGVVHHVAWRAADRTEQDGVRQRLIASGLSVTPVLDRLYFESIYFREPAGILFELASDGPGFAVDEDPEHLGESVALPPFLESRRDAIVSNLRPLEG